ncbi:MAG: guanylate kinase [Candidatus Dadabacteria bacterium]|nr:MAG: guanylate kinase [Candidatus Dadabacteria bacterium]
MQLRRRGSLIIVSGPSGAGKTSVCGPLLDRLDNIRLSVSVTTRPPRGGERNGIDYVFVDDETFERMVNENRFAEWARVHGHRYGTAKETIEEALAAGIDLLLDIDVQGAAQIKAAYPDAAAVFLLPPSRASLERRLRMRGTDDEETVSRRLEAACREIAAIDRYDYVVVNDDLERTIDSLVAIVRSERSRVDRLPRADLERLISEFAPRK